MSDRTLGRFRARCLEYEAKTGIDLIHEEIRDLSSEMAAMMKIDGTLKRMFHDDRIQHQKHEPHGTPLYLPIQSCKPCLIYTNALDARIIM